MSLEVGYPKSPETSGRGRSITRSTIYARESQLNALNHTHNEQPRPTPTITNPSPSKPTQLDFIHRRLLLLYDRRQRERLRLPRRAPSQHANMRLHVPVERQRDVLAGRDLARDVVDLVLRRLVLEVQLRPSRGCDDSIPDDDLVLRLRSRAWLA